MALDITVEDTGLLGTTAKNVLGVANSFRSCCTDINEKILTTKGAWQGPQATDYMGKVEGFYAEMQKLVASMNVYAPELIEKTNAIKRFFGDENLISEEIY